MINKKKILHVLPLTENYSIKHSGAASILVRSFVKDKNYKHYVVGSTEYNDFPSKNYNNIQLTNSIFVSKNNSYIKKILEFVKSHDVDILEVHNRPEIALKLKKETGLNTILYYHNEPQKLRKSNSKNERMDVLDNIDNLIFVSEWVRSRFFDGIKYKNSDKCIVFYPTINRKKISKNLKKKIILFIGKLNSSKGYNIFSKIIPGILDKYKDWHAITIGTEPREKIVLNHPNVQHKGWLSYTETLKYLRTSSIVVSPSIWDEPFGRVINESCLYGNASLTTNKGGIPEANFFSINLKKNNIKSFKFELEKLIKNKKILKKIQANSIKGFNFTLKEELKKINKIRNGIDKKINLNRNKPLKIIHVTDQHIRHKGRLYYSTGKKITNGLANLGTNIINVSDRDIATKNLNGGKAIHNYIMDLCSNFKPDLILFGHADKLDGNKLVNNLKKYYNGIKTAQWFLDPLIIGGPDYIKNKNRILLKSDIVDFNFLTTEPNSLKFNVKNSFFIPNPVDKSIHNLKIYSKRNQVFDLFYAMSHGQHRGNLKSTVVDERSYFLNKIQSINDIKLNFFGIDKQPVWGDEFFKQISLCKMGLNLSRGPAQKYYSSDRISALMGNGLLTFIDKKYFYRDFFTQNEIIEYQDVDDLIDKLKFYKLNDKSRINIAKKGCSKYHKIFSSKKVCNYMLSKIFGIKLKNKEKWMI